MTGQGPVAGPSQGLGCHLAFRTVTTSLGDCIAIESEDVLYVGKYVCLCRCRKNIEGNGSTCQ